MQLQGRESVPRLAGELRVWQAAAQQAQGLVGAQAERRGDPVERQLGRPDPMDNQSGRRTASYIRPQLKPRGSRRTRRHASRPQGMIHLPVAHARVNLSASRPGYR